MDIIETVFVRNNLVVAFAVVGVTIWVSYLLADKLLTSKISQTAEIADGPFYAKTVVDYKDESKSKVEYFDLANEILKKVGLNEEVTEFSDNRY